MKSLIFFVLFCVGLRNVICLHYEYAFDVQLYRSVLNTDLCDQQIQLIRATPSLMQRFIEVNSNIPHDLSAKGVLTYTGDYDGCLAVYEHNNGNSIQGKYAQVTVDVPDHINNYEYMLWDNFTWKEVVNNFHNRQSIQLSYVIGCKAASQPNSENWAREVNTTTITLGVCIPKPCSASRAIDFVLDTEHRPLILGGKIIERKYLEMFYRLPSDKPISSPDIIFIIVSSCIILFAILGTTNDIKNFNIIGSAKLRSLFRCFSVHKNIHQLLKSGSPRDSVECVDGLRALAMALIIWFHCFYKMVDIGVYSYTYSASSDFLFYSVEALSFYGVDTFLLLGGIFNVYSAVRKYKNPAASPFLRDLHKHLLNRLVRLYPVLCFTVLMQASVMFHIGDGPRWYKMAQQVEACRSGCWPTLLFIQNIISVCLPATNIKCLLHTWYVSLDMQLFLISTLVLIYLLGKNNSCSWTVLVIPLLLSMACSTTLSFLYNFKKSLFSLEMRPDFREQYDKQYYNLPCRASSYFAGMLVGYFLICKKDIKPFLHVKKVCIIFGICGACIIVELTNMTITDVENHGNLLVITLPNTKTKIDRTVVVKNEFLQFVKLYQVLRPDKIWIWFLWMMSILLMVLCVTSMTNLTDYFDSQVLRNLINSNMMVIWSFTVSWIIVACHFGHGGPVNWLLSLKQWKLLSRLSYTMYIVHMPILTWLISIRSDDVVILKTFHLTMFQYFCSAFFITFIFAFIVTVLIEIPILNLYKLLQGPSANKENKAEDKRGITLSTLSIQNGNEK